MNDFAYYAPTKVFFGKGSIAHLPEAIRDLGLERPRFLLVYGGGSIKKAGLYGDILRLVKESGGELAELSGVDPNPKINSVREGVLLCRKRRINAVIGAGGGSAIDCAKAIAVSVPRDTDPWETVIHSAEVRAALPLIAVPTLSATGTETDGFAVISNPETGDKVGIHSVYARPAVAIMDPEYTFTVSPFQTGAGAADIFSHVLEVYFDANDGAFLKNRMCEAVMKTVVRYGEAAVHDPKNYEARSNLMWAASVAINGELSLGSGPTAWSCHGMEHPLSGIYDITHGAGLAVLTPHWMRYILNTDTVGKFAEYAVNVFNLPFSIDRYHLAALGIDQTQRFFDALGMPSTLRALGVPDDSRFHEMALAAVRYGGVKHAYVPLTEQDVEKIYRLAL